MTSGTSETGNKTPESTWKHPLEITLIGTETLSNNATAQQPLKDLVEPRLANPSSEAHPGRSTAVATHRVHDPSQLLPGQSDEQQQATTGVNDQTKPYNYFQPCGHNEGSQATFKNLRQREKHIYRTKRSCNWEKSKYYIHFSTVGDSVEARQTNIPVYKTWPHTSNRSYPSKNMNNYAAGRRSCQMNLSPARAAAMDEPYIKSQIEYGIEYPTPHKNVLGAMNDWARDAYYYNVPTGKSKRIDIEKGCTRLDIRAAADELYYRTFLEKPGRAENEWQPLVSVTQIDGLDLSRPRNENDALQFDSASSDSLGPFSLASSPADSPSGSQSTFTSPTSVVSAQGSHPKDETPEKKSRGEREKDATADPRSPIINKATPMTQDTPSDVEQAVKAKASPNMAQHGDKHTSGSEDHASLEMENKQHRKLVYPPGWQAHPYGMSPDTGRKWEQLNGKSATQKSKDTGMIPPWGLSPYTKRKWKEFNNIITETQIQPNLNHYSPPHIPMVPPMGLSPDTARPWKKVNQLSNQHAAPTYSVSATTKHTTSYTNCTLPPMGLSPDTSNKWNLSQQSPATVRLQNTVSPPCKEEVQPHTYQSTWMPEPSEGKLRTAKRSKERDQTYRQRYRAVPTQKMKTITASITKAYRKWNEYKSDNTIVIYNPQYDKGILPKDGNQYSAAQNWAWTLARKVHSKFRDTRSQAQAAIYDPTESGEWSIRKPTIQRTVYNIILKGLEMKQCKLLMNTTGWLDHIAFQWRRNTNRNRARIRKKAEASAVAKAAAALEGSWSRPPSNHTKAIANYPPALVRRYGSA